MGVGISLSGLSSAVANRGAIGVIAGSGIAGCRKVDFKNTPETNRIALCEEIRAARSASTGILGINIMVALSNYPQLVETAIQEGADIIFAGAGLPLDLPRYLPEGSKTALVPIVSSPRAARILCRRWLQQFHRLPDAVVVEGPLAGGHLGFAAEALSLPENRLENLVARVIEVIAPFEEKGQKKIPVIAAGGIYTRDDILRFLSMGASGVQMATRFVVTRECDAAPEFKQAYLDARKADTLIIHSPVGLPGRVLRSRFAEEIISGLRKPFSCPYHCIATCQPQTAPFCIAQALVHARRGHLDSGIAFAGANAWKTDRILTVAELIDELTAVGGAPGNSA
jgi:nitronate monooxygenase